MQANPGKELELTVEGRSYLRIPVRTELIKASDDILQVVKEFTAGHLKDGDLLVVSEKVVAITQGRAFRMSEIKPSRLATFLSKFVYKSPYGIGLGSPIRWNLPSAGGSPEDSLCQYSGGHRPAFWRAGFVLSDLRS